MNGSKRPGKVVVLEREMIEHAAFRSLSGTAHVVLLDFLCRRRMVKRRQHPRRDSPWQVENNGEITYPYAEAERKGITRPAFTRALDQLIGTGFLDVAAPGHALNRAATAYALSDRWRAWGTAAFCVGSRARSSQWGSAGFQKGHTYHPPKPEPDPADPARPAPA